MSEAQALAPLLRRLGPQSTCESGLAPPIVDALFEHNLLRALLPKALNGRAVEFPDWVRAIRIYAAADASTGWCLTQGSIVATMTGWLPPDAAHKIWSQSRSALANGPPLGGTAIEDGRELRVSARWGFSSGYHHATYLTGAVRTEPGNRWVMAFFPKAQTQPHDTWSVAGLKGTGSVEFSVNDAHVGEQWYADMGTAPNFSDPIFRLPTGLLFATGFASLALGVTQALLEDTLALTQHKQPRYARSTLGQDPHAQERLGRCHAQLQAASAYLLSSVDSAWSEATTSEVIEDRTKVSLRSAGTHGLREAKTVAATLWEVAATTGIYTEHPLHQRMQDMQVIGQHVQARAEHYAWLGRYLVRGEYEGGPLN